MYRRKGIISLAALGSLLLCGANSPSGCTSSSFQVGPSKGEVAGVTVAVAAVVVVGVVVLVDVNKSHHTIKGCVTSGANGLELRNVGDRRTYALTNIPASVKVGDVIKLHGTKQKGQKNGMGDQDFRVEKMSRDYGPCRAAFAPAAAAAGTS
jgi:hypothetical protein